MKPVRVLAALALVLALGACAKNSTSNASPSPSEAAATTAPAASPATSGSAAATVKVADSSKGKILTDAASGKSLYTFDVDTTGKSNCTATCAQTWPPLTFSGSGKPTGATGLDVITRADGSKQVALNGKPLYTYSGDTKAGDVNGDGFAGKWHLAKSS